MITQPVEKASPKNTIVAGYADPSEMPLAGYATLLSAYALGMGAFLTLAAPKLPSRIAPSDVLLMGIATHEITRVLTRDWVTAPLRAPFTRYEKSLGNGEVLEKSRGTGLQKAIGDLLTCQWCSGPWVAGALTIGLVFQPKITRVVAGMFTAVAVSDVLHHLYAGAKKLAK
jgi:hypothetical protein